MNCNTRVDINCERAGGKPGAKKVPWLLLLINILILDQHKILAIEILVLTPTSNRFLKITGKVNYRKKSKY